MGRGAGTQRLSRRPCPGGASRRYEAQSIRPVRYRGQRHLMGGGLRKSRRLQGSRRARGFVDQYRPDEREQQQGRYERSGINPRLPPRPRVVGCGMRAKWHHAQKLSSRQRGSGCVRRGGTNLHRGFSAPFNSGALMILVNAANGKPGQIAGAQTDRSRAAGARLRAVRSLGRRIARGGRGRRDRGRHGPARRDRAGNAGCR